ncbi:PRD domain-containing protein [Pectobacterium parmentieri]|uniref:PRD domain-containing protein n=2 Tax=Pectobacterium parmentieri TaxID=1905730 RepID=A0A0H3I075_PECPM|nr:PRD domain-containing protein [Pectobacterium parmentieri]ACX86579.1 transcriptional antiterminator, BglG [Pectobacterium parmentieri WPP163]AFI88783.1 Transcription antiterminator LicT [Pectobacterium parmentieri]AOR60224.1 transcription antiterminator LicT [Pectobacterium parmentieri]AYH00068.1 PRD domain-containing protein [Pectobacterium parmentieri]AYH04539.1 PRD domain-containing protein [Pectobacterium parmentieri]
MKIIRILSNNAVLAVTDKGEECVALGRGIGFGKKDGDSVNEDQIDSRFLKTSNGLNAFFAEILADIPPVYLSITEKIIMLAREVLGIELQDTLFLALNDHINFSVKRHNEGIKINNQLLWEVKLFYPKEFSVGLRALDIIEEKLQVRLPEDEAGFIAFHLANAANNSNMESTMQSATLIKDILTIVKYDLNINYDENSIDYQRFITHLKFFSLRLFNRTPVSHADDSIYDGIKELMQVAYACAMRVFYYVEKHYQYKLTTDEIMFLTIHINRLNRNPK